MVTLHVFLLLLAGFETTLGCCRGPYITSELAGLKGGYTSFGSGGGGGGAIGKDYQKEGLREHNKFRAKHKDTPQMELDSELNKLADKCAEHYANKGTIDHSCPHKNKAGENLYAYWGPNAAEAIPQVKNAVAGWYGEIKDWDFSKSRGKGGVTGHFTQVVWKGSTKLGIGFATKDKGRGSAYIVGLYKEPGNWAGRYKENVKPLKN